MKRIRIPYLLSAALPLIALCAVSCGKDLEEEYPLVKLGAIEKEYLVEADGGNVNIPVYSNGAYHIERLTQESEWLKLEMPSNHSENGYIRAECDFNKSFRRQVVFLLCSDVDDRRDTITFRQKGLKEAFMTMDNRALQAKGAGGENSFSLKTNIPSEDIERTVIYPTATGAATDWITDLDISEGGDDDIRTLTVTTTPNPDEEIPRSAQVYLRFVDGWGETVSFAFNLIQRTSTEKVGTEVTMQELKYEIAKDRQDIDRYVIVKGIVVSDRTQRNCGENEQLTLSNIDYSLDRRTIYLESEDGTQGICLITKTVDDNVTKLYDKVEILLYGTYARCYENPSYVVLSNVTSAMFVSNVPGEAYEVPAKNKNIRDLTDDDIFTYVTLRDVEIPVRKGNIMPVNEGYTVAANGHRLTKYPRLIRDINGDDMYMYINSTCMWRMHGDPVAAGGLPETFPYGSGSISGVIVHERFSRFEWENGADPMDLDGSATLGRIGTYQIRPQRKADVWDNMKMSVEESFSKLLCEYRYWRPDRNRGVCLPTYGNNGWFTHTYQQKYTGNPSLNYTSEDGTFQHMNPELTFDYLGPKGKAAKFFYGYHPGNMNGLGILIDPAKESWDEQLAGDLLDQSSYPGVPSWCGPAATSPFVHFIQGEYGSINYTASANEGKGLVPSECYQAFSANEWWNYETNRPYGWLLNFSTVGISASHISLQIAVLNMSQTYFTPRYWKVEWNTTDVQTDAGWTEVGRYTVPDISVWSNTLYHSIIAFKHLNFELPLEILGKPNVYLRLVPENDICSGGIDYADSHLNNAPENIHTSAISYIAIRYN